MTIKIEIGHEVDNGCRHEDEYYEKITVKVYGPFADKETCHAQTDGIRNAINDYLETLVTE
ncbi:hypothetical protein [Pseudomonas silesiensis]